MIYTLGEIVLDIITHDFDNMRAKPGGSMLNTAITLGRLGMPVNHISYLSFDQNGRLILDFLAKGDKVVVTSGPLSGVEGEIVEVDGGTSLIVRVRSLLCAKVTISRQIVRPSTK